MTRSLSAFVRPLAAFSLALINATASFGAVVYGNASAEYNDLTTRLPEMYAAWEAASNGAEGN